MNMSRIEPEKTELEANCANCREGIEPDLTLTLHKMEHVPTLTLSPRFMYQDCFSSAGRGNGRGAMPFLMSFALEPEIVALAWIHNASVQFPHNICATKGWT